MNVEMEATMNDVDVETELQKLAQQASTVPGEQTPELPAPGHIETGKFCLVFAETAGVQESILTKADRFVIGGKPSLDLILR